MARFLKDDDYFKIRSEIKIILDQASAPKLKMAEDTAIDMCRKYLSGRFDCNLIFTPHSTGDDVRSRFIIDITISIALYKLYQQLGMKDIPEHRKIEYDDAIEWLKMAGRGDIPVDDLPTSLSDDNPGEMQISSRTPTDWKT